MSLADPNDEYSDLVPAGAGKIGKFLKKARFYFVLFLIGIIVGAYLQFAFIAPLMSQSELSTCSDCVKTRELLNKENNCLYNILPNPHDASAQCRAVNEPLNPKQNPASSGASEEVLGPQDDLPINSNDATLPENAGDNIKDFNEEEPQP